MPETPMTTELDALTREARKLKRQAAELAMELHDVAEDLPRSWERILEVAQRTYDMHVAYLDIEQRVKAAERVITAGA